MSIFIGNEEPKEIYIGNKQVKAIYKGSQLIWSLEPEIPEGYVRITLHFNFENAETRQQFLSEGTMASIYYETYTNDADIYDDIGTPYTTNYLYFHDIDSNDNLYLNVVQGDYVQLNVNVGTDKYGSEFSNFNVSYDSLNEDVTYDLYVAAPAQDHTVTINETVTINGIKPEDDYITACGYSIMDSDGNEYNGTSFTVPAGTTLTVSGWFEGDASIYADGEFIGGSSKDYTITADTTINIEQVYSYPESNVTLNISINYLEDPNPGYDNSTASVDIFDDSGNYYNDPGSYIVEKGTVIRIAAYYDYRGYVKVNGAYISGGNLYSVTVNDDTSISIEVGYEKAPDTPEDDYKGPYKVSIWTNLDKLKPVPNDDGSVYTQVTILFNDDTTESYSFWGNESISLEGDKYKDIASVTGTIEYTTPSGPDIEGVVLEDCEFTVNVFEYDDYTDIECYYPDN